MRARREIDVPIEKFFYFGKDGTIIVQEVGVPAYTQRRRRAAARSALEQEGLPIPDSFNGPISAYPGDEKTTVVPKDPSLPVPEVQEPILEPFEVPTKQNANHEPWALIVPPKN